MYNLLLTLIVFFVLSSSFSLAHHENKSSSYKKSSYYKIAEDLIDGELKDGMKLTVLEKNVLTKFRNGVRQPSSKIKHFVSALGKHKCVSASKTANIKTWPIKSSSGEWYEFTCKNNDPKKLGPAKMNNNKMTKPGKVVTKPSTKPGKGKVKNDMVTPGKKNNNSKNPKKLNPSNK